MHLYSVYGLGLHSEFPIPELLECDSSAPDIVVRRAPVSVTAPRDSIAAQPDPDDSWAERRAEDNETLCVFSGVGRYLVRAGGSVLVDADRDADFAAVRHLLLGPVLAHLLWQRGMFALHASALCIGGRTAAFVGVSGEGKSTLAAALVARGHELVCDDVAALEEGERLAVRPGFPRIRLHADSLAGLGEDATQLPRVHMHMDKRLKSVAQFAREARPLDRLYVLATGPLGVEPLGPGAAVMELLRHTYYAHQYAPLYGFPQQLQRATSIARRLPAYRLTRPKDLARLGELVGFVEAHVAA